MAKRPKALTTAEARTAEEYVLTQFHHHFDSETYRQYKDRVEDGIQLYRGELNRLFPDEASIPAIPYVENKFKNALHDITRLAAEGRGAIRFIPRGDKDKDMRMARVREGVFEGYWLMNRMRQVERKFYMDLAGTGLMAASVYYDGGQSPYPLIHRLDPRFLYPDVRNGRLFTLTSIEEVKERVLAHQFPHLELNDDPENQNVAVFACVYTPEYVAEAVVVRENETAKAARIVKSWRHDLERIPVGFEMLDTYDGAFHGLFEQVSGPLMVRNKITRFLVDYLEQMAHAPVRAKNVINADDQPGPTTIYQIDPNADDWVMDRLPPAAPAGSVFGLLSYMGDQEEKEAIMPPSRSGNVSQSIASGSFVDRTQGQLTSVTKEAQDKMASFREQLGAICGKVDETHLDFAKPLIRPVAGKKMYTPTEDIDGWYHHEVKFGAGAGLDRIQADQRVQAHLTFGLISKETARGEIDYLSDMADEQDKIDRENLQDAIFQRLVSDPATPMSSLGRVWLEMKSRGASMDEALEKHMPDIIAAEEQIQAAQAGAPAPSAVAPEEAAAPEFQPVEFRPPSMAQVIQRS